MLVLNKPAINLIYWREKSLWDMPRHYPAVFSTHFEKEKDCEKTDFSKKFEVF